MEHRVRIRPANSWQRKSYIRGHARAVVLGAFVALLPLLLAVALAYFQSERGVQNQVREAERFAAGRFDVILKDATVAAQAAAALAGRPCAEVERALRQRTVSWPLLQSVDLVRDGKIYCTSGGGTQPVPQSAGVFVNSQLRLSVGDQLAGEAPRLIYRVPVGDESVLIGIDGSHLADVLELVGHDFADVELVVGSQVLKRDGSVSSIAPDQASTHEEAFASSSFPFAIRTVVPDGAIWRHFDQHYRAMILLIAVLGVLAGVLMYRQSVRALSPRAEIQRALAAAEFVPFYQPVVRAKTGEWAGVEVLLRWRHPVDGMIPADLFVPYTERSGLIVPITEYIMERCGSELSALDLPVGFHVGFNISAAHCGDLSLVDACRKFLARFDRDRIVLVLELTEREIIKPYDQTYELFDQLHEMGVRIAIDDFGTGHSSYAYLQKFKIDYLKIDRSFVAAAGSEELSEQILASIIDLANRLGLDTVAEGVENEAQRKDLLRRGVNYLQGFLFAQPMPLDQLLPVLARPPGLPVRHVEAA